MVMFMLNTLVLLMEMIIIGLFGFLRPLLLTKEDPFKDGYLNQEIDIL